MDPHGMRHKRAVLASARLQFAPEVQSLREAAQDHMVLQMLAVLADRWYTPGQLVESAGQDLPAVPLLLPNQVDASLARLRDAGDVDCAADGPGPHRFRLTGQRRADLEAQAQDSVKRLAAVAEALWPHSAGSVERYAEALLACLCDIFARLGELYVQVIIGEGASARMIRDKVFRNALGRTLRDHPGLDAAAFEQGLVTFFSESSPDYDAIKWNLAQNFYLARALGMDDAAHLLSASLYGQATFYIDTNALIPALEPESRHHQSFRALGAACQRLGIKLRVAQITLDELRHFVLTQKDLIRRAEPQVPDELVPRIADEFFRRYKQDVALYGSCALDELFADLDDARAVLSEEYGVEVVDDAWFDAARESREVADLVGQVQAQYQARKQRPKHDAPALHDALLLLWVQQAEDRGEGRSLVVTLDTSLPGLLSHTRHRGRGSVAITLDALLQWISPLSMQSGADLDDAFAQAFAGAVRYNLLPHKRLLDLKDFRVFSDLNLSCAELPAEDVERCLEMIEARASTLAMDTAEGREQLNREVVRFFAGPGLRYQSEVDERDTRIRDLRGSLDDERERAAAERAELEATIASLQGRLGELGAKLASVEEREAEEARAREQAVLRRQGWVRCAVIGIVTAALWALVAWLAWRWSAPPASTWERLAGTYWPYGAVGALGLTALHLWVGPARLRAMGLLPAFHKLRDDER